jgi:hypothetical protein
MIREGVSSLTLWAPLFHTQREEKSRKGRRAGFFCFTPQSRDYGHHEESAQSASDCQQEAQMQLYQ